MNLEPVRMNTDEFYHILRSRIFEKGPAREAIDEFAQAYARAVRDSRQLGATNASPSSLPAASPRPTRFIRPSGTCTRVSMQSSAMGSTMRPSKQH